MIDYAAGILDLTGHWLVGNKKKIGFVIHFLSSILWIVAAFKFEVYGLLIIMIPSLAVTVRNYIKWRKEDSTNGFW